jgi:hypothetical protein
MNCGPGRVRVISATNRSTANGYIMVRWNQQNSQGMNPTTSE